MTLKEIVKLPYEAKFDYAIAGILYYSIRHENGRIIFPIDMNDRADVGTTTFVASYKPLTLMRYIRKALERGELIEIPLPKQG